MLNNKQSFYANAKFRFVNAILTTYRPRK